MGSVTDQSDSEAVLREHGEALKKHLLTWVPEDLKHAITGVEVVVDGPNLDIYWVFDHGVELPGPTLRSTHVPELLSNAEEEPLENDSS